MTGENKKRYSRPALVYHFINLCTYFLYKFLKAFRPDKTISGRAHPLLITGLFRSGTTITARIVNDMGFSSGPGDHLLRAIGSRKWLNPEGFLENHFFMELSMYLFHKTDSWGDAPPAKNSIASVELNKADDDKMVWFSVVELHEDRISNLNKLKVQLNASASQPQNYLNTYFSGRSFIKNPHISVLLPYFKKILPDSEILVVFRYPADAVKSARNVTPLADMKLYELYYEELCEEFRNGNKKILFFSYDKLIEQPELSVSRLAKALGAHQIPKIDYVKKKAKEENKEHIPDSTMSIYNFMLSNCINA